MAVNPEDVLSKEPAVAGFFTPEENEEVEESPIDFLLRFAESQNIAEELDDSELSRIGQNVKREFEIDETSRTEWRERYDRAHDIVKQSLEEKSYPWPGASNIHYPLIQAAAMQFHARAYPAIIDGANVVKPKLTGADRDGKKSDKGNRIAAHMSYQLLEEMEEWEEETDKLLLIVAIAGSVFRKSYYSPVLGRNVSEMATADKVVVNYNAPSLERAPRITHEIELYPHEITERQTAGVFLDTDIPNPNDEDPTKPVEFLEQHRLEDLDEDGYPEPYIVTVHKESGKVVRITARYDEDRIMVEDRKSLGDVRREIEEHNQKAQAVNQQNFQAYQRAINQGMMVPPPQSVQQQEFTTDGLSIQRIEPIHYFTMYGFIPAVDGGLYYDGLGTLLLPLNEAINSNINMMLDAGHVQNTGGGFLGGNLKISKKSGGRLAFKPNEYKKVDTGGAPIRDAVFQFQHQGPSTVLFQLLGLLIDAGREIAAVKDITTGEAPANQPATTTLALLEQGQKVFTSIYKRIHRSLKKELKKLRDLNAKYLPPRVYFNVIDSPQPMEVTLQDYSDRDIDVIPVSNPNVATDMQQIQRAQALMMFNGDPLIDQAKLRQDMLKAMKVDNPEDYFAKQQKNKEPDPRLLVEQAKIENEMMRIENQKLEIENKMRSTSADILMQIEEMRKIRSEVIKNLADAESKEVGAQLSMYEARMKEMVRDLEGRMRDGRAGSDRGNERVATGAGNQAVPQVSGGATGGNAPSPGGIDPVQGG